jgi:F420-dependent oxidoreductase-like protein
MVEVSVMIEGQDGLNWPRWTRLGRAAEDLGFTGIYRSDHFSNPQGPWLDALELMTSLTWLASHTQRIRFGAMVSPVSFRDPVTLAWQSSAIDSLAGGRLDIGLGAGWQEREHSAFGYELLPMKQRFDRLREGLEVVRRLTRSDVPVSFEGEYFTLRDAMLNPRSPRSDGPPITIGGAGPKRTMPLVARYADEWNSVHLPIATFKERDALLAKLLEREGRPAGSVRRTMMGSVFIGANDDEVRRRLGDRNKAELIASGQFVGTPNEILEQLQPYLDAKIDGFKLRIWDLDDISALELIAADVLPTLAKA